MRAIILWPLFIAMVSSMSSAQPPKESDLVVALRGEIQKMDLEHPEKDAKKNILRGDSRFLGIYGYSVTFPGTPEDVPSWDRVHQHGYRGIAGTADTVFGEEHRRLIEVATRYAERYNRYIWSHITRRRPKT
jgi:hypothetical protein